MAKIYQPVFTQLVKQTITVLSSTTNDWFVIAQPGIEDSRITKIIGSSSSTTENTLLLGIDDGFNIGYLGHSLIPSLAGTTGTINSVDCLALESFTARKVDSNANPYFELSQNNILKGKLMTPLATGEKIIITVFQEDY